jgi:acetyl/propionyl-CoA carboxylase alpha subunit
MLAKLIAWAPNREQARQRLIAALTRMTLLGLTTNQSFLIDILKSDCFATGQTFTTSLESQNWTRPDAPEYVRHVVSQATRHQDIDTAGTTGPADKYSPWRTLGAFRTHL